MAADANVVLSLSDTKVALNSEFTEVLWVQVRDIKITWDDLVLAMLYIDCMCSDAVNDRFRSTFNNGEGHHIVKHATFLGIFHFENCSVHNNTWPDTNESEFWDAKVVPILDRFFPAP